MVLIDYIYENSGPHLGIIPTFTPDPTKEILQMATYNLEAIKARLGEMTKTGEKKEQSDLPKFTYFKPEIGETNIRFLPYSDAKGQPFQEVVYYQSKKLSEKRIVAPAQFGLEDPIAELEVELRKDRSDEVWNVRKELRGTSRFYAPIIVRGREDEGVQLWELSSKLVQDVYAVLTHEDYASENLMDPYEGYDWTVTAIDSGKKFNGYVVKDIKFTPRRKSSPIFSSGKGADKTKIEALIAEIPDLNEFYRKIVPATETLKTTIENFLNPSTESEDEQVEAGGVEHGPSNTEKSKKQAEAVKSKLDSAFDELEDLNGSLF